MRCKFIPGHVYRHKNAVDVNIRIDKVQFVGHDYVKVYITYIQSSHKYVIVSEKGIRIYKTDWDNWRYIE